ncbi:MAG: SRPBCC domain-containing protein [Actinomycetota bacterium]
MTDRVTKRGRADYEIYTDINIEAPAATVWETLTDFAAMPAWSSSFQGLDGDFRASGRVSARFKMMGRTSSFEHDLIDFVGGSQWAWSDPFGLGMVDHHVYRVESVTETTSRFVQTDQAKGGAALVLGRLAAIAMRRMYTRFNAELKAEVERRAS